MNAASNSQNRFSDKKFRGAYLWDFTRRIIALQMRALRGKKTQKQLEAELGIKQSWISKLEDETYGTVNVRTLLQVASSFDVGLLVRFVPYSEFFAYSKKVSPKELKIPSYEEEAAEHKKQLESGEINLLPEPVPADTTRQIPFIEPRTAGFRRLDVGVAESESATISEYAKADVTP